MNKTIIVTRHQGLIEWLRNHGIIGEVIPQATAADVAGKDVYGVLPLWLAAEANSVTEVSMPKITLDQRKNMLEMTPEDMDAAGATLVTYQVRKL